MKGSIPEKLLGFRDRILRRLEKPDQPDPGQTVFRTSSATYEIGDRVRAVACAGVSLIHELAVAVGLPEMIDRRVQLLKIYAPYHDSDHVLNIAYNLLAGGTRLEHLELLRNDENYLNMMGVRRIPDPTTAGDYCRRFDSKFHIDCLQNAINDCRLNVWKMQPDSFFDHAIVDADGTICPTTGECKEGQDISHKGTWGYQVLVVSLANTQEVLFLDNRSASRPSHEGAADRLDQSVDLLRRAGFRKITLRGDTDFSQTQHLDRWNTLGVEFVFGYDARENLKERAERLPESAWRALERGNRYEIRTQPRQRPENVRERIVRERLFENQHLVKEEVAEFGYRPGACTTDYRMVVVRKTITHERGQKLLFVEQRYFFYITNKRDVAAREIVRVANTRCNQERLIAQLKGDVHALCMPVDNLHSNWAYAVMAALAWNLSRWWALVLPDTGRWAEKHSSEKRQVLKMHFTTFVNAFMRVPAQVVHTGRRLVLRLLAWNPWQRIFFRALGVVRAIS